MEVVEISTAEGTGENGRVERNLEGHSTATTTKNGNKTMDELETTSAPTILFASDYAPPRNPIGRKNQRFHYPVKIEPRSIKTEDNTFHVVAFVKEILIALQNVDKTLKLNPKDSNEGQPIDNIGDIGGEEENLKKYFIVTTERTNNNTNYAVVLFLDTALHFGALKNAMFPYLSKNKTWMVAHEWGVTVDTTTIGWLFGLHPNMTWRDDKIELFAKTFDQLYGKKMPVVKLIRSTKSIGQPENRISTSVLAVQTKPEHAKELQAFFSSQEFQTMTKVNFVPESVGIIYQIGLESWKAMLKEQNGIILGYRSIPIRGISMEGMATTISNFDGEEMTVETMLTRGPSGNDFQEGLCWLEKTVDTVNEGRWLLVHPAEIYEDISPKVSYIMNKVLPANLNGRPLEVKRRFHIRGMQPHRSDQPSMEPHLSFITNFYRQKYNPQDAISVKTGPDRLPAPKRRREQTPMTISFDINKGNSFINEGQETATTPSTITDDKTEQAGNKAQDMTTIKKMMEEQQRVLTEAMSKQQATFVAEMEQRMETKMKEQHDQVSTSVNELQRKMGAMKFLLDDDGDSVSVSIYTEKGQRVGRRLRRNLPKEFQLKDGKIVVPHNQVDEVSELGNDEEAEEVATMVEETSDKVAQRTATAATLNNNDEEQQTLTKNPGNTSNLKPTTATTPVKKDKAQRKQNKYVVSNNYKTPSPNRKESPTNQSNSKRKQLQSPARSYANVTSPSRQPTKKHQSAEQHQPTSLQRAANGQQPAPNIDKSPGQQ